MDAKKYRILHKLDKNEGIKPHLTLDEIKGIEALQRIDIGLLAAGLEYKQRQEFLANKYHKWLAVAG